MANVRISFFFLAIVYKNKILLHLYIYIYIYFFFFPLPVYPLLDIQIVFHVLAVVTNGATNREYKCDFDDFTSSGYRLRSGAAESYGGSLFPEEPPCCFPYWL